MVNTCIIEKRDNEKFIYDRKSSWWIKKRIKYIREVKPIFNESDIKLHIKETEYANHAFEYSNTLDFKNMDGLCAIGGDGTMHEIINGMLKRDDKKLYR